MIYINSYMKIENGKLFWSIDQRCMIIIQEESDRIGIISFFFNEYHLSAMYLLHTLLSS